MAQKAANERHGHTLAATICARGLSILPIVPKEAVPPAAQSSARPIPGGCPQAFAACSLCRREIEKGGWGWKIAFTEVFGPHRIENFKAVHRLLNPMPPSCPVRRSLKRSKSTPPQRLTARFVPPIRTASAGSRAGLGADRPRISVVGTLSLSVLICAGVFAAQTIVVKLRHKHHAADESVAAKSNGAMRVASHQADDAEDDNSNPVSVPSRFRHVHAPAALETAIDPCRGCGRTSDVGRSGRGFLQNASPLVIEPYSSACRGR